MEQEVEVGLSPSNKNHFERLGYIYTKQGDKIKVCATQIFRGSKVKVNILCDYCLEEGKQTIFQRGFDKYTNSQEKTKIKKDTCKNCRPKFKQEVFFVNYGVINPLKLTKYSRKSAIKRRKHTISSIRDAFEEREYLLLSTEYENVFQKLNYICLKHPDKERSITMQAFSRGYECIRCSADKKSGSNNCNWIGSRELHEYLRSTLVDWKKESMKFNNYQCVITGLKSNKLHIHHLISFTKIMNDCLKELELNLEESIANYSDHDLLNIKELCLKKHFELLGIPIMPDLHYEFHRIYGKGSNTPKQFKKFKNEFKGEI